MIPRDEYLLALDKINNELIDVLIKWMINEKGNLDSFLANPVEHVLYNPFVIPDTVALQQRSELLTQVIANLSIISDYAKGTTTKSQRDFAIEQIPHVILTRLLNWMEGRYDSFVKTTGKENVGAPISEYGDLVKFNIEAYLLQMKIYSDAIDGVKTIVQYKKEQEIPPDPIDPPIDPSYPPYPPEPVEPPVEEPPEEPLEE